MARYTGGTQVKGGYYWNPKAWAVEVIPQEGGRLPGSGPRFVKIPFPLLFVLVPVLGALFLMFMPVIGFALLLHAVVKKVTGGVKEGAADLAATVHPGWQPGEAHFTGKPAEGGAEEKAPTAEPGKELKALEEEIARKRKE